MRHLPLLIPGLFCLHSGQTEGKGPRSGRAAKEVRFALVTLSCEPRGLTKSARNDARRRGYVPAVIYGKGVESTPIMVPGVALRDALKTGARNQLIRLEGLGQTHTVLIKELQLDHKFQDLVHVDFMEPAKGRKVRVRVPVRFYGEDSVTKRGLIMTHQLNEVEVECEPDHIPAALTVDLASRTEGDHISVADLSVPGGVRVMSNPDAVVLNIDVPLVTMVPGEVAADVTTAGG
ncbi:MAG: ribosomal protein [Symbiobacteriaceae bacterium]|nr:ribosomal protein [Symbiobacteriaceae bacterium]